MAARKRTARRAGRARGAPLVIGLDLGTTGIKAIAVTADDRVVARGGAAASMRTPRPGWATQDAEAYWRQTRRALAEVTGRASAARVDAIAISGAMHTLVPIGRDDRPLTEAITWADARGADQAEAMRREHDTVALHHATGCPVRWLYAPARLRWWRQHDQRTFTRAARFVSIKEWVTFRLTGRWAVDASLASSTGLLRMDSLAYDRAALGLAGVEAERLSPVVPSESSVSELSGRLARSLGLRKGTMVIAGGSDGALANLGAAGAMPGRVVISVGTSGAVRFAVDRGGACVDDRELTWCYHLAADRFVRGAAMNNGGIALRWLADVLYGDVPASRRVARLLRDAAGYAGPCRVDIEPYVCGERTPLWNPFARGAVTGLTLNTSRAELAHAGVRAVCACVADLWDALGLGTGSDVTAATAASDEACLTGAITRNPAWAQTLADTLGVPLRASESADASALGAARLGQLVRGRVPSLDSLTPATTDHTYRPDPSRHTALAAWRRERAKPL